MRNFLAIIHEEKGHLFHFQFLTHEKFRLGILFAQIQLFSLFLTWLWHEAD